jgi:purine-binding chemotaxis protein CheW
MVIEAGRVTLGLLVDSVAEVVNISATQIDPTPAIGNDDCSRYIHGVYSTEREITVLIDLNRLIADEEQEAASLG